MLYKFHVVERYNIFTLFRSHKQVHQLNNHKQAPQLDNHKRVHQLDKKILEFLRGWQQLDWEYLEKKKPKARNGSFLPPNHQILRREN